LAGIAQPIECAGHLGVVWRFVVRHRSTLRRDYDRSQRARGKFSGSHACLRGLKGAMRSGSP
jgi:hypothetical protein